MRDTIRSAHSGAGMTSGCFRYSLRSVNAAFFFTMLCDVLPHPDLSVGVMTDENDKTYGDMSNR